MFRVNVIYKDGTEVAHAFCTNEAAWAYAVRLEEYDDVVSVKVLTPDR